MLHTKPDVERVQALADISRSALCCYSNGTRVPIANPPSSAQLEGTPLRFPFPQVTVVLACGEGTDRQTYTQIHTDGHDVYILRRLRLTRNVIRPNVKLKD